MLVFTITFIIICDSCVHLVITYIIAVCRQLLPHNISLIHNRMLLCNTVKSQYYELLDRQIIFVIMKF
jgi:hypothetical protein